MISLEALACFAASVLLALPRNADEGKTPIEVLRFRENYDRAIEPMTTPINDAYWQHL